MTNQKDISPLTLWVMTVSTGLCVASLYYCQPLLHQMQISFNTTSAKAGWIPTLTQLGYAFGILFLVPLGDRFEKRFMIVSSTFISSLCLLILAFTQNLFWGSTISFFVGVASITPQFIIPFAVTIAPDHKKGKILGVIMGGLLLGILLARTLAGFVGAEYGWRAMFLLASAILFFLGFIQRLSLPKSNPSYFGSYLKLLKSVFHYVKTQSVLRESMLMGSMFFGSFCAFWATLIYLMESPAYNYGARAVGLFGVLGAAGALTAPIIGKLSDKKDPRFAILVGAILLIISYLLYLIWGGSAMWALIIGVLIMDIGLQGSHVSNQSRIFSLIPEARSRLNTAYMFSYFIGGALGSYLGTYAWSLYGWTGVCVVCLIMTSVGMLPFLKRTKR